MADTVPVPASYVAPNINTVYTKTSGKISSVETDINSQLSSLKDGGELTQADLLKLQYNIARYTITVSTYSSVMKEFSDTLKQTANKIS